MKIYIILGKNNQFKGAFRSISNIYDFLASKNLNPLGIAHDTTNDEMLIGAQDKEGKTYHIRLIEEII